MSGRHYTTRQFSSSHLSLLPHTRPAHTDGRLLTGPLPSRRPRLTLPARPPLKCYVPSPPYPARPPARPPSRSRCATLGAQLPSHTSCRSGHPLPSFDCGMGTAGAVQCNTGPLSHPNFKTTPPSYRRNPFRHTTKSTFDPTSLRAQLRSDIALQITFCSI